MVRWNTSQMSFRIKGNPEFLIIYFFIISSQNFKGKQTLTKHLDFSLTSCDICAKPSFLYPELDQHALHFVARLLHTVRVAPLLPRNMWWWGLSVGEMRDYLGNEKRRAFFSLSLAILLKYILNLHSPFCQNIVYSLKYLKFLYFWLPIRSSVWDRRT